MAAEAGPQTSWHKVMRSTLSISRSADDPLGNLAPTSRPPSLLSSSSNASQPAQSTNYGRKRRSTPSGREREPEVIQYLMPSIWLMYNSKAMASISKPPSRRLAKHCLRGLGGGLSS